MTPSSTSRPAHAEPAQDTAIERRHNLGYDEFMREYLIPRKPVIVTGALTGWKALERWTPEFFKSRYGTREVRIAGVPWKLGTYIDRVHVVDGVWQFAERRMHIELVGDMTTHLTRGKL